MTLGPTPIAEPQQPQVDPAYAEQIRKETLTAIFGDKYGADIEKAKQGYWYQNRTIAEQAALLDELSQQAAPRNVYGGQPPVQNDPLSRIQNEYMIPADVLREAIRAEAGGVVRQELAPLANVLGARERISREIPDFINNEAAVVQHAANDPLLNQRVQRLNAAGLADEALRVMYEGWRFANPVQSIPTPAAHAAAALPGAAASPAQRAVPGDVNAEQAFKDALAYARATKDEDPVWMEMYKNVKFQYPGQ